MIQDPDRQRMSVGLHEDIAQVAFDRAFAEMRPNARITEIRTPDPSIRSLVLIGTQRVGWRRIWLDFFEDQSIAWCQMPGGVATVLRTPRPPRAIAGLCW